LNCILDTNVLIDGIDLTQFDKVYIPIKVIEELDHLKINKNMDLAFKAKSAIKQLHNANNIEIRWNAQWALPSEFMDNPDNQIISFAKDCITFDKECTFLSNDYNVRLKSKYLDIPCMAHNDRIEENMYKGYKTISGGTSFINDFYDDISKGIN
jgi:predicted ribonuclease YlaK